MIRLRIGYRIDLEVAEDAASDDEIYDWLHFHLGLNGTLKPDNPLVNVPMPPPARDTLDWQEV